MREVFLYSARAILPLLFIMALGYLFGHVGKWSQDFYRDLNALSFRIFLPTQLFCNIYETQDLSHMNWRVILYVVLMIFVSLGLGYVITGLLRVKQHQRGVVIQATFRSNQAIVGYPLCQALGGDMGFAAMTTAAGVSFYNGLGILILTWFAPGKTHTKKDTVELAKSIARNPLIIGSLTAIAALLIRQGQQVYFGEVLFSLARDLSPLYQAASMVSLVASPLMLFVLGARMDFSAVRELLPLLLLGSAMRLVVVPGMTIGLAVVMKDVLHLTTAEMPTLIAVCASPVAVSSAVMVQEIGGDEQLAGQLVAWSSALSMVTIFCFVFVLRSVGLL